jgi:hypothetical protein
MIGNLTDPAAFVIKRRGIVSMSSSGEVNIGLDTGLVTNSLDNLEEVNTLYQMKKGRGFGGKNYLGLTVSLPVKKVMTAPMVFQARFVSGGTGGDVDTDHASKLKTRLEVAKELDPILVLPVGSKCIVIDGHHRLEAYKSSGRENIPALVYAFDPYKAYAEAMQENQKIRAQVDPSERSQRAWVMIKESLKHEPKKYSHGQITEATSASARQLGKMAKTYRSFIEANQDIPESWFKAIKGVNQGGSDDYEYSDSKLDEDAMKLAVKLRKVVPKLDTSYKRQVLARALTDLSPKAITEVTIHLLELCWDEPEMQDHIELLTSRDDLEF